MKISVSQTQGDGFSQVEITHGNESLLWNTGTYGKIRLEQPTAIFDQINTYLATMNQKEHEEMFKLYKELHTIFEETMDVSLSIGLIRRIVTKIYAQLDLDKMKSWLLIHGNLHIPTEVKTSLDKDQRHIEGQTYLRHDYINIAVICLALRLVIPIWGEYIDQGDRGTSNELYKEIDAYSLIEKTSLVTWPKGELSAHDKLLNYLSIVAQDNAVNMAWIVNGMGSNETPMWLLSNTLVRRLTIVPLTTDITTNPVSIISNIYGYITNKLKPSERRVADRVKSKITDDEGSSDDDHSFFEVFKIKSMLSEGDRKLLELNTFDAEGILRAVDPTVDMSLHLKCQNAVNNMNDKPFMRHQILLTQWCIAKGYPARALEHVNRLSVKRLVAMGQTLLWHWGFHSLAATMIVESKSSFDQHAPSMQSRPTPASRMSRISTDKLMEAYPYGFPPRGKDPNIRKTNIASEAVSQLTAALYANVLHYQGPKELEQYIDLSGRIIVIPTGVKNIVTDLAVHIASINKID